MTVCVRARTAADARWITLPAMSNAAWAQANREEEIAFLAMEEVLRVDIRLADAGAGNKMPDGAWLYPDGQGRRGIVEITSPPAAVLMKEWAAAKREGRPQSESGSVPTRFGELAQVCTEMLATDWARENLDKLLAQPADERHLFLFGRGHDVRLLLPALRHLRRCAGGARRGPRAPRGHLGRLVPRPSAARP